jgi:hypothetical protein
MATNSNRFGVPRLRTNTIALVTLAWSLVVLGILVWQAILYRGLVAQIGEWQFSQFSRYFPFGTIILLFALFTFPFYIVLYRRFRRWTRRLGKTQEGLVRRIERARFWRTALTGTTVVLVLVSVGTIFHAYSIGDSGGGSRVITVGEPSSAPLAEGTVTLRGVAMLDRIANYHEDYVVADRDFAVVPLVARNAEGQELTYFVQLARPVAGPRAVVESKGYLRNERLAGALRMLYLRAGYKVASPAWILYRDVNAARWTHLRIAGVIAIFAILTGLVALQQMRRLQRLSISTADAATSA